jgi:hypothetical protein
LRSERQRRERPMAVLINAIRPSAVVTPNKTAAPAISMPIRKKRVMTGMNSQ